MCVCNKPIYDQNLNLTFVSFLFCVHFPQCFSSIFSWCFCFIGSTFHIIFNRQPEINQLLQSLKNAYFPSSFPKFAKLLFFEHFFGIRALRRIRAKLTRLTDKPLRFLGFLSKFRGSHRRCSIEKGFLKNFAKFKRKHLCQSVLFNKFAGVRLVRSSRPGVFSKKGS